MGYKSYQSKGRYNKTEYKKFRVRSTIKSFRDLEVYQKTTELSAEIFSWKLPEKYRKNTRLKEEFLKVYEFSKQPPILIASAYGEKFNSLKNACDMLEKSVRNIDSTVAKIDFLGAVVDNQELKEKMLKAINKYQNSRRKILNLKRSWNRIFGKGGLKERTEKKN